MDVELAQRETGSFGSKPVHSVYGDETTENTENLRELEIWQIFQFSDTKENERECPANYCPKTQAITELLNPLSKRIVWTGQKGV